MGNNVIQTYRILQLNVYLSLDSIRDLIDTETTIDDCDVHWGHVGNLNYVLEHLDEIKTFLKNDQ
jgi:hypothetical protein